MFMAKYFELMVILNRKDWSDRFKSLSQIDKLSIEEKIDTEPIVIGTAKVIIKELLKENSMRGYKLIKKK